MFEVVAVSLEVFWETTVVACLLVIPGGGCIDIVCVDFSALSLSVRCGGMIVHCAVGAFVLLERVGLYASLSATLSTHSSVMAMAMISTIEV